MTVLFLHQNMYRWGGAPHRDFRPAFRTLAIMAAPLGGIRVAGLTEVTNDRRSGGALADALGPLGLGVLGRGAQGEVVGFLAVIHCGSSALGTYEFVAVAVSPSVRVVEVGRVYRSAAWWSGLTTDIAPDPELAPDAFLAWCHTFPPDAAADYRACVYVVVEPVPGVRMAVGFLHNVYRQGDNRVASMLALPWVANRLPDLPLFLGGDFNTPPAPCGTRRGRLYPYARGVATTMGGNEYDYWYGRHEAGPRGPWALVSHVTQDPQNGLSDHAASVLMI